MFFKDVKIYIRISIHNFYIFAKIMEINPDTNDPSCTVKENCIYIES